MSHQGLYRLRSDKAESSTEGWAVLMGKYTGEEGVWGSLGKPTKAGKMSGGG